MTNFKYKKALVTGGAGFIGSHIVDALLSKGCKVVVIDNLSTGSFDNLDHVKERITFFNADIRNQDLLTEISNGCDVIFHLAAVVFVPQTVKDPVDSAMVNEIGTIHVLEAARRNNVRRVVFSSSCAVYGDDPEIPKYEHMSLKPQSPYAVQKLAGEYYARLYNELYGVDTVCLRYFNVYGPRQNPSSPYSGVISIFIRRAIDKSIPIIYGDGNQYRDFVFVEDVIKANLQAAQSGQAIGKIINIGTGRFIRIYELWQMIGRLADIDIEPDYKPARPGDVRESIANIDLSMEFLGFEPAYGFETGLKKTFDWYKRKTYS